jgi:hypothetical protein
VNESDRVETGEPVTVGVDLQLVEAVRASLTATFPGIDVREVLDIARRFGRDRLPAALMMEGSLADRSANGLAARLGDAADAGRPRRRDPHALFSTAFYDFLHPDVAAAGIAPWLHYQVFGVAEGVSPHFLLDIDYLAQSMPETPRSALIDDYLRVPSRWFASSSPYANVERFVLSGEWDHVSHPLIQILTTNPHWLHPRLMMVDSAWGDDAQARLNGVGYLLTALGPLSAVGSLRAWPTAAEALASRPDSSTVTIAPGFVVAEDSGPAFALSRDALSRDHTILRLPTEHLAMRAGDDVEFERLVVLASQLDRDDLAEAVSTVTARDAIAPYTRSQERALIARGSGATVLPFGRQARVRSASRSVVETQPSAPASWSWRAPLADAATTCFVLTASEAATPGSIAGVEPWLDAGATLCIVDELDPDVLPWRAALARSTRVVASLALDAVRPFVTSSVLASFTLERAL